MQTHIDKAVQETVTEKNKTSDKNNAAQ